MSDDPKPLEDPKPAPVVPPVEDPKPADPKPTADDKSNSDEFKLLKEKLDRLYSERDTMKEELEAANKKIRDDELERLKSEGKEVEALQGQLDDAKAEIKTLNEKIIKLTRDNAVIKELGHYDLRNDRAKDLAYDAILKDLVQDEKGEWVHKAGKSLSDFIKSYFDDEDNAFLLKPKVNRGTDPDDTTIVDTKPVTPGKRKDSLFGKSQAEVLRMAEEGKLPRQR